MDVTDKQSKQNTNGRTLQWQEHQKFDEQIKVNLLYGPKSQSRLWDSN